MNAVNYDPAVSICLMAARGQGLEECRRQDWSPTYEVELNPAQLQPPSPEPFRVEIDTMEAPALRSLTAFYDWGHITISIQRSEDDGYCVAARISPSDWAQKFAGGFGFGGCALLDLSQENTDTHFERLSRIAQQLSGYKQPA